MLNSQLFTCCSPFSLESAILADSPERSHIQRVFQKACQCIDGFTDSLVLVCYYHHSCHRSDRTSLLMVTYQIQSVCRCIRTRQLICSHVISFLDRFIGSMFHTGNIHLANDFTYIYVHCTCHHKIYRNPRALQSLTTDFFTYRLFRRVPRLAAPEAAHLELSGQNRHVPP